jgi:hypothetical protein
MHIAAPALKNTGGWQGYWQYTAATGVIVFILITIMVSRPDYDGLFQRLLVIIIQLWWGVLVLSRYRKDRRPA